MQQQPKPVLHAEKHVVDEQQVLPFIAPGWPSKLAGYQWQQRGIPNLMVVVVVLEVVEKVAAVYI